MKQMFKSTLDTNHTSHEATSFYVVRGVMQRTYVRVTHPYCALWCDST